MNVLFCVILLRPIAYNLKVTLQNNYSISLKIIFSESVKDTSLPVRDGMDLVYELKKSDGSN